MLTQNSSPEQVKLELNADEKRACYWFIKQHGGEKGYNRFRTRFAMRLISSGKNEMVSDAVEYTSPHGNKWLTYEHAVKGGYIDAFTHMYCVCYFETASSYGAFVRTNGEHTVAGYSDGCILFTPHFFSRFAERMGIEKKSRAMLLRFLQLQHHPIFLRKPARDGFTDEEVVIRYPGSYAFGSRRTVNGYEFITIRTFIPATQLSPQRKKQLIEFGEFVDEYGKVHEKITLEKNASKQIIEL